jgi:hypothetical protein
VTDLGERVELVLHAPLAASVFVKANEYGMTADDLTDPAVAVALAGEAHNDLQPWAGETVWRTSRALAHIGTLTPLVTAVLDDPRNHWWWTDLQVSRQLWLSDVDLEPLDLIPPTGPTSGYQNYTQHLAYDQCIVSSTELDVPDEDEIRSGLHLELSGAFSTDWSPEYPVRQGRLHIREQARIYEIHEPLAWHRLAIEYGDSAEHAGADRSLLECGIDNGLAPTWARVANDWDAVHLSFFGLLVSLYRPINTADRTTTLWNWCTERTMWVRNCFTGVAALEPVTAQLRVRAR